MFSILEPGKHLPPHRGPYNGVLRLHLGLIVPEPREQLGIRVDNDVYRWQEGEAVIFDDAYEHEAWNRTPHTRVVLFVDFRKPLRFPANVLQLAAAASRRVHALHPRGRGQPEGLGEEVLRGGRGVAEPLGRPPLHWRAFAVSSMPACLIPTTNRTAAPKVSFVSLGCPKALVDSERIVTRLRAEGYELSREHAGSDLVIVNTCGFLDSAKAESLAAIGKALKENGKVIVTGCMGAEPESISAAYPDVLAITGPQQYESVVEAVHRAVPPQHDPFLDLVPPEGIKLTPRHYAYLKISEGCNNRCTFCIIPRLRGDLVSRPAGDVLREAEKLVAAGVKELLVISQDTSAYGVDIKYATSQWRGREVRAKFIDLRAGARRARRLGAAALRLPLPARRRRHPADGRAEDAALSRHPVPARVARRAQTHEAAGRAGEDAGAHRDAGATSVPISRCARPSSSAFPARPRRTSRICCNGSTKPRSTASAASNTSRCAAPPPTTSAPAVPDEVKEERWHRFMQAQQKISRRRLKRKVGTRQQVIIDEVGPTVAKGRSMADAPEIDGAVYVVSRRPLRVGEIATVKIERADEYDLHGSAVGF